jgi:hypothetical protein
MPFFVSHHVPPDKISSSRISENGPKKIGEIFGDGPGPSAFGHLKAGAG